MDTVICIVTCCSPFYHLASNFISDTGFHNPSPSFLKYGSGLNLEDQNKGHS